jgi:Bifunctional DNA primase/polymerase, N-terminal
VSHDTGRLRQALAYAAAGWPVLVTRPARASADCPVTPGGCAARGCKAPLNAAGVHGATTDPDVIASWLDRWPDANLALATGQPGPAVLDIDVKPGGSGWPAYHRLRRAGLLGGAVARVRTPSGGGHVYFPALDGQCSRYLRAQHLELKAAGTYIVTVPSVVHGKPYVLTDRAPGSGEGLDWDAVTELLAPPRPARPARQAPGRQAHDRLGWLTAWMERQDHRRAPGLFWAACRAAEEGLDPAPLIPAAVAAGVDRATAERTVANAIKVAGPARSQIGES